MLIDEISFANVYVFCGAAKLQLVSEGRGLTLVIARNNAGKTSILRALKFLFYGPERVAGEVGGSRKVINLEALRRAGAEPVNSFVEAKLRHGDRKFTLRRSMRSQVPKGRRITDPILLEETVTLTRHEPKSDTIIREGSEIDMIILSMLPKRLFDCFFFKGEELLGQLVDNPATGIGKELFGILFRKSCELTSRSISGSISEFDRQLSKAEKGQDKLAELAAKLRDLEKRLEAARAIEKRLTTEFERCEKDYLTADADYVKAAQNANPELGAQLQQAKEALRRALSQEESVVATYHEEVRKLLLQALPGKLVESSWTVLKLLREKKLLPPAVTEGLLAQLLREEQCICGRPLAAGDPSRVHVEEYRRRAQSVSVSDKLYSLYSRLQPEAPNGVLARRAEVLERLDRSSARLSGSRDDVAKREDQVRALDGRYDEKEEARVSIMKRKRDVAFSSRDAARMQQSDAAREVRRLQDELRIVERDFSQVRPVDVERDNLAQCRAIAGHMRDWAEDFQGALQNKCHKTLSSVTKKIYSAIVTDKSDAIIDPLTLLPDIRKEGAPGYEPGGGQRQVLLLAFLIAMDELRKELGLLLRDAFRASTVSDQCFFMDSVFSPMDPDYRAAVAGYLPGDMAQLVFLVAPQHWDEDVAKRLLKQAQRVYVFVLNTDSIPEQEPRAMQLGRQLVPLVKLHPSDTGAIPYSVVVEVKV